MLRMFYFSGTGNARNAARWMVETWRARGQAAEAVDLARTRAEAIEVQAGDDVGLASPTHGFNFPPITLAFLLRLPAGAIPEPGLHHQHARGSAPASPVPSGTERCGTAFRRARVRAQGLPRRRHAADRPSLQLDLVAPGPAGRDHPGDLSRGAKPPRDAARTACSMAAATCARSSTCHRTCCLRRSPSATTWSAGSSSRNRSWPRPPVTAAARVSSSVPSTRCSSCAAVRSGRTGARAACGA